jgi:hypothetical protein
MSTNAETNTSTLLERVQDARLKAYDLYNQADDWDMATHWSHYNGAFSLLAAMLERGLTPEEVLSMYEQVFEDFEVDSED